MKLATSKEPGERQRRITLKKPADAIRLLAGVLRDMQEGRMPIELGRATIYGLSIVPKLFEISNLDQRLSELEQKVIEK